MIADEVIAPIRLERSGRFRIFVLFDTEHLDLAAFWALIDLHIQRTGEQIIPMLDKESESAELNALCALIIEQHIAVWTADRPNLS